MTGPHPSPARVAADRGRTERRAADADAATRREASRARCQHGALRARSAEPFAGPTVPCPCCRSWFGTLRGDVLCPECRDDADSRAQEAAVTVEPAHPVPAPTLERQGDAESREDEVALRAEIARSIEEAGVEYASTLSWISTEDDRKRYVAAMAFARAARIARGSSS